MKEWLDKKLVIINYALQVHESNTDVIHYYEGQRDIVIELLEFIKNN